MVNQCDSKLTTHSEFIRNPEEGGGGVCEGGRRCVNLSQIARQICANFTSISLSASEGGGANFVANLSRI